MNSDTILDCAQFQLSPRRTHCELFVSGSGRTEKLASGLLKPFVSHLTALNTSQSGRLMTLEAEDAADWFSKGTVERFVRFVSTPEVLESVGTFYAEMGQLERARVMYSEGGGDEARGGLSSENETASTTAADLTKRELLRAIDVRLVAVKHDLTMACARASAAGFTLNNVSELLLFAKHFGADRLTDSCTRFISLCQRHPESISHQRPESTSHQHALSSLPAHLKGFNDGNLRSSASSDMSIDEPEVEPSCSTKTITSNISRPNPADNMNKSQSSQHAADEGADLCQQPKPIGQSLVGKDVGKMTKEAPPSSASDETSRPGGRSLRRLSVQDRINLFETKQKEQSPSPTVVSNSTSGGANRVGGKPELRRFPSDASEKLVLRRWSGASDMSIDITNSDGTSYSDRKDSPLTLSSSVNSYAQTGGKTENETNQLNDTATSLSQLGFNVIPDSTTPSSITSSDPQVGTFPKDRTWGESTISRKDATASKKQQVPDMEKDEQSSQTKVDASLTKLQQVGLNDQVASMTKLQLIPGSSKHSSMKNQEASASGIQFKDVFEEQVQVKDCTVLQLPSRVVREGVKQAAQKNRVSLSSQRRDLTRPNLHVKDQPEIMTKINTFVKPEEVEAKTKSLLHSNPQIKLSLGTTEGFVPRSDPPAASPPRRRAVPGKEKEVTKEATLHMTPETIWRETYAPDQTRKLPGKSDFKLLDQDNAALVSLRNKSKEGVDMFDPHSTSSTEHVQELRPSKGNQERNDVLQMKAVELEKLFAAHKLRIHSDQTSSRRSKPIDGEVVDLPQGVETRLTEDIADKLQEKKLLQQSRSNISEFDAKLPLKMAYSTDYNSNTKQGVSDISSSNEVRGKFYAKYMQRRDAKLREEWESKTPQKEAKTKAMFDSLERSHAEMKAKFTGSPIQHNMDSGRHHAEKIKYSKARSALKTKGQIVENLQREEEDLQEHYKHFPCAQDMSFNDTVFDNELTTSNTSKRLSSSKLVASTIRTPVGSVPRPHSKGSNSASIKHRTQPENPLAQSVPNFSYFTKENMKPSIGLSKITPRSQSRNTSRTKGSDNHVELGDLSPLNYDIDNKTKPLKISKEKTELVVSNKFRSSRDVRPFLRKGDGVGPGSRSGILKMKSSMASEILISDEESEGLGDHDRERDIETLSFSVESDSEKSKVIQEIGKFGYSGSETGDVLTSLTQEDCTLLDNSSKFDTAAGIVPGSPGESPGSWNSVQDSFSYNHEASDIDTSIDSPTGSRASWNSQHPSETMETDNGRMRKKWGRPQVPVLIPNDSDVPKGFKRLLKFGRIVKGTEFLNDGVSASTASEADDDTEDCHDLANRSSDDLRKSRMGYPVASYDGFTESEVYPEQAQPLYDSIPHPPANFRLREEHISGSSIKAPRSFFSLSSFRSKGSEPKLR